MKTTRLILVGGFLGAGKTTLLWEAAQRIMNGGQRVGLITNDQAPELVDTAILSRDEVKVAEVNGSCFCCNFPGLIEATKKLKKEADADVIIAEPVGSCTDLSATIVQPLKENLRGELLVSPLTVLADPMRLTDILNGGNAGLHPSAAYIFRKQLEESDILLISKADLISAEELVLLKEKVKLHFPDSEVMTVSSVSGEGMDEWLNKVQNSTDAGKRLIEVDYDVYAEGEAVLGWLNSTIELTGESIDWDAFARKLMQSLSSQFDLMNASVGHVKILIESGEKYIVSNLTGLNKTLTFRESAGTGNAARLTVNARVEMSPETLEDIVRKTLDEVEGTTISKKVVALRCLSPGRPNPTYRFDHVVS
ncbi:MAG: GTP-binding protein [Mariniphaga sp.]|nr:GTP-binding protein [Mariniphaga sp.]